MLKQIINLIKNRLNASKTEQEIAQDFEEHGECTKIKLPEKDTSEDA